MSTMTRISKRDENVKKLGTSSQNDLSDAGPSPPATPTSYVDNHDGDDLKCSLFIVGTKDLVDLSSKHAQLGGDPSSEYGPKQLLVRRGDQDPCLPAAEPGVAYEPSIADEFSSGSPLFSPLFSPIDGPQPDVTSMPQASSTPILIASGRAREEVQVTEASVPRPQQLFTHDDTSSTTAIAGPTAERSRPASAQGGLLPVCALDIDFLSPKPRAENAPLLALIDSSSPHTQRTSSVPEVEQHQMTNTSSASSNRQKRKPTGSTVGKDRSPSFITNVGLSCNVLDPSSTDPGSSTNKTFNGRNKKSLAEVAIPVTPTPFSAAITNATTPRFPKMSEEEERELVKIIDISIQKTGLISAPKELIARSRRQKRKRNKSMEATASDIGPDAPQPAISEPSSTTTATDSQEAPAPKTKRKRTTKPKKERQIMANPYPRTTTTPPDEGLQQEYPFDGQQIQESRTDNSLAPMTLVNPASMSPMNVSRSNGGFDQAQSLAVHGNNFCTNSLAASTHASAFQHTQSSTPGSTPYSFDVPRNLGINHPQGIIPDAVHPGRPAYNPASMNFHRLYWHRAQIARQMQAGLVGQRYHSPLIPNAMSMPVAREGGWNPQAPSIPSQPSMDAGFPYFFDAAQSTQGISGQPGTESNVYPQYQAPNFDHNIQSDPYHMQHPLFNQALAGPSHLLQTNVFSPPAFNAQLTPSAGYEPPFPSFHFGRERQREVDYMTRPAFPAIRSPMQNYPHGLIPSFMNHTVAPIGLDDEPTMRGQIPVATSSRTHPTLPGSFISDELTNELSKPYTDRQ